MLCSPARIAANRRNSLKSTGPRTAEGKEKSRANALKHGLCSSVLVEEDAQLIYLRAAEFFDTLKPRNHLHCWMVTQVSIASIRIDRCVRMERRARDKIALKAELGWDDDRLMEATLLGEQLANRPEVVAEQLRKTPQGCEWLMGRWAMLAHSADVKGGWTPIQESLAFDLLGTPVEFREGHKPGALLDFRGLVLEPADDPAVVARREIDALELRRELVGGLDEANRALAVADLNDEADAELARVRRYEAALHRRMKWYLDQIRIESPSYPMLPGLRASWIGQREPLPEAARPPEPVATPEPERESYQYPEIHPPFCLEPDEFPEPGQKANIPLILAGRAEKKLRKAEARREVRRRRLEILRA